MGTFRDRLKKALLPSDGEMLELARREVDPAAYDDFTPITVGPALTVAGLLSIGFLAVVTTPYRLFTGLRRRSG